MNEFASPQVEYEEVDVGGPSQCAWVPICATTLQPRLLAGSRLRVILLHHAIAIPTNPQVAPAIDEAAVCTMGQIRRETGVWIRWLNERWIAKPRNRVAIAIEHNNRRRRYRRSSGVLTNNCAGLIALLNAVGSYTDLPTAIECVDIVMQVNALADVLPRTDV